MGAERISSGADGGGADGRQSGWAAERMGGGDKKHLKNLPLNQS